ncbi:MAG: putative transporter transrane protein [Aeromicrobium sp.]|nr:putative transporter transrane protein [Aeromicrobium sp.]
MSAGTVTRPVTIRRVIGSEWIKFWTLRSTVAVLAAAMVGMVGIALIIGFNTRHLSAGLDPEDSVQSATLQGYYLGQLLIGALGVLFVSGEYSTGMIRSTFAAVPRRLPVLWAKLLVFVTVTAVAMISMSVVAFVAAQSVIGQSRQSFSLSDPGVLRVVIGTGVYLTLIGAIGAALGWIIRSTPGALVAYVATILVIPVLFSTVLGDWGKEVAKFLPSEAGASFSTTLGHLTGLGPWTGLAVMVAWVLAGLAAASILLTRRDA